ncbi:MAG: T9SS C-terminal target domain-containing protein, partial [Methanobacteriota archaeon]
MLYVGTDSTQQCCHQVFVAEYDTSTGDFQRRFGVIPSPDWIVSGFSVGDFDGDGFKEFATGSGAAFSHVYIWENTGNDSYTQVYVDTLTTGNAYMTASSNDIDGNGKIEFFVGGSSFYNGVPASRVYWFEADGNNQYTKVRSIFMLGTDVLGTTELYSYDINGDDNDDLVFSFSFKIIMLVWNPATQQFDIYYVDEWENYDQEIQSINMYDVFNSDALDLFVNIMDIATAPRIRTYLYRPNPIVGIPDDENPVIESFSLEQNYPNPFNGSTIIRFRLPGRNPVSLTIYDVTGKEVIGLIDNQVYAPGEHSIKWNGRTNNGKEVSSGIYFYELRAEGFKQVKKM